MKIITISREFGSGGRELGKRLAEELGIHCYDHEIIELIAKEHGFDERYVANISEKCIEAAYPTTIGHRFAMPPVQIMDQGFQVAAAQQQIAQLQQQMQAQADGFAFDHALDTAILGKQGRSVKAVRALLDVDALKGSKDLTADIAQALEAAAKANPWAFGEVQPAGYPAVRDGGEGGKTPTGSAREQFAAWAEQALK